MADLCTQDNKSKGKTFRKTFKADKLKENQLNQHLIKSEQLYRIKPALNK